MFKKTEPFGFLDPDDRMDGKTVMITGANSGLGFATSVHLAKLGANVIMACRSGIPDAGEKVKKLSGSDKVYMKHIDLADLESVNNFCHDLKNEGVHLDVFINNAAVVPSGSRKTKQGLEQMFVVNYLSPFFLVNKLLEEGIIPNEVFHGDKQSEIIPRIVIVSSESHRSGNDLDIKELGEYKVFTMKEVIAYYGYYKLALTSFAEELNRRINPQSINVAVHSICPGAVNTNIAREAPKLFQPLLKIIFGLFFQDPMKAAEPVTYLASSKQIEHQSGHYLHMWAKKSVDSRAQDGHLGSALWDKSNAIIKRALPLTDKSIG